MTPIRRTERPGTGEYDGHKPKKGVYNCAGCNAPLYNFDSKFSSGCGWPAFFEEIPGSVRRNVDRSMGMERTEIVCAQCNGHLGMSVVAYLVTIKADTHFRSRPRLQQVSLTQFHNV